MPWTIVRPESARSLRSGWRSQAPLTASFSSRLADLHKFGVTTPEEKQILFEKHLQSQNIRIYAIKNNRDRDHFYLIDLETGYISLYSVRGGHFSFHYHPPEKQRAFIEDNQDELIEILPSGLSFDVKE